MDGMLTDNAAKSPSYSWIVATSHANFPCLNFEYFAVPIQNMPFKNKNKQKN